MMQDLESALHLLSGFIDAADNQTIADLLSSSKTLSLLCSVYEKAPEAFKLLAKQAIEKCSLNVYKRHEQSEKTVVIMTKDEIDSQNTQNQPLRRSGPSRKMNTDVPLQKVETHAAGTELIAQVTLLKALEPINPTGAIATLPSEEIPRRALDSISPNKVDSFSPIEMISSKNNAYEAIRIIQILETYPSDNLSGTYQRMLQHVSRSGNTSSADSEVISDLSTWAQIMDTLEARTLRDSAFSMLACLEFYDWFSEKVSYQLAQKPNREGILGKRIAEIHVLDRLVGYTRKTGDEMRDKMMNRKRSALTNWIHKGEAVKDLVQQFGLGIVFSSYIWDYIKMKKERRSKFIDIIKADASHTRLFEALGEQLDSLTKTGKTSVDALLLSMYQANILSKREYKEMVTGFLNDKLPKDSLKSAMNRLKNKIYEVLGTEITPTDITIKGIDFPCSMLEQLYSDELIGTNLIHACLTMSGKKSAIRFGQCISLDIVETVRTKPHRKPFQLWAKNIRAWKESSAVPLVYFCPLLHYGIHFSLLEINELEKKIYHYDSMTPVNNPTRVFEAARAEFGDLNFAYEEAPTPQQKDGSSSGIMVIRNARRRMNGLHVGSWSDALDVEHLRIELVQLFISCIEDGSMTSIGQRKRKRSG